MGGSGRWCMVVGGYCEVGGEGRREGSGIKVGMDVGGGRWMERGGR